MVLRSLNTLGMPNISVEKLHVNDYPVLRIQLSLNRKLVSGKKSGFAVLTSKHKMGFLSKKVDMVHLFHRNSQDFV